MEFDFSAAGPIDFGNVRFELKRRSVEQIILSFAFHAGTSCMICGWHAL